MEGIFYEDRMSFNYLPFLTVFSGEYFGFKELLRGCLRTKMAVTLEDSLLLKIRRQDFDKYLKDFD
jgi:CRP-like cAMP-binding protein